MDCNYTDVHYPTPTGCLFSWLVSTTYQDAMALSWTVSHVMNSIEGTDGKQCHECPLVNMILICFLWLPNWSPMAGTTSHLAMLSGDHLHLWDVWSYESIYTVVYTYPFPEAWTTLVEILYNNLYELWNVGSFVSFYTVVYTYPFPEAWTTLVEILYNNHYELWNVGSFESFYTVVYTYPFPEAWTPQVYKDPLPQSL